MTIGKKKKAVEVKPRRIFQIKCSGEGHCNLLINVLLILLLGYDFSFYTVCKYHATAHCIASEEQI